MDEATKSSFSYTPVYDEETSNELEKEFSRLDEECYLDHAGTTLYTDTQISNISDNLRSSLYANPHSIGIAAGTSQDIIERMRFRILDHFHTSSDEYSVIFTSGATHSMKIIAETFTFNKSETELTQPQGHFVYTEDNHTSVLGMREVVARRGAKVSCLSHDKVFKVMNNSSITCKDQQRNSNSIFVYPAQCNFSGLKYPLEWIKTVHSGVLSAVTETMFTKWYVLLDAAGFVPTNNLDLSTVKPDFVCLSFYKMFGYPTGIGALLVKNSSASILEKTYYGGGTVEVALSSEMFHIKRPVLHQRFEDGTVPFLSIISLQYGFDILAKISMEKISSHVFSLARYLYHSLLTLHHYNNEPVVKIYSDTDYESNILQGGVVTFNLMRSNGEYVGYMEVVNMAALFKIHIRTGCFCNPGACQRHLSLSTTEVLQNYDAGYICGGTADLIDGKPTGAIRVSFGYMSTIKHVETLLLMIKKCFLDGPEVKKVPHWWESYRIKHLKNFEKNNTNIENNETENNDCMIINKLQNTGEKLNSLLNEEKYFAEPMKNKFEKKFVLARLFIYPIKSCAAYEVTNSWSMNSKGLQYDREWMIITSTGVCLTQKHVVNLCLLKPIICKDTKVMTLTYPGMPSIQIPLEYSSQKYTKATMCRSRVCGHKVEGIDCGSDVSEWLSLSLGRPNLRLIRQCNYEEQLKEVNKSELSFSSQAQYLLLNAASILWLTDKIPSNADFQKDTVLHRFRGNLILNGCVPFEEIQWKHIRIGNNNFTVNGPCTRCQMICIDQMTGTKTVEPLRTLAEQFHGKLKFGIYLTRQSIKEAEISVGDIVECT